MLTITRRAFVMRNCPTPTVHASTLLMTESGPLIAWFGGSREGADDVCIWMTREIGGDPRIMASSDQPHWNPVLCSFNQKIYLFYKVGRRIAAWETMVRESIDGGESFKPPRELIPGDMGGRGPVRSKPIEFNGRLLAPASLEDGYWRAFVDITENCIDWRKTNEICITREAKHGLLQPTLWTSPSGVHALIRSTEGMLYRSDSTDGEVFGDPYPTDVPNNNSGVDIAQLGNTLYLAYNPVAGNWAARTPLSIAVSYDDGVSWQKSLDIETAPGEYSYPALVAKDGTLHLTYTYNRTNIAYVELKDQAYVPLVKKGR